MSIKLVQLGELIAAAKTDRAGKKLFPILSMTMREGLVDQANKFKKRVASEDTSQYKIVQEGQLVVGFPIDEGVLSFQQLYSNAIVSPAYDIWDIRNKSSVYPAYLEKFLRSPSALSFYKGKLKSTTARRRTLPKDTFLSLPVPLPPLEEQKRIAAILDQADSLRRLRQRSLDRLNTLSQAIFYEMFGDVLSSEHNPELASSLKFVTSGGRGWSKYYADTGIRFIRSFDVQMNHISDVDAAYVNAPNNAEARRTAVQDGDVLLTITGSKIGRVASIPNGFGPAFVSQHVAILRIDKSKLDPSFLSHYLSLENGGQKQIAQHQYGQTKPGLNFDQIGRFVVPIPPIEKQKVFINRIKQLSDIKITALRALQEAQFLFASLQHRAFRGEL